MKLGKTLIIGTLALACSVSALAVSSTTIKDDSKTVAYTINIISGAKSNSKTAPAQGSTVLALSDITSVCGFSLSNCSLNISGSDGSSAKTTLTKSGLTVSLNVNSVSGDFYAYINDSKTKMAQGSYPLKPLPADNVITIDNVKS